MLAASGQLNGIRLEEYALVGELALDGSVRSVPGALSMAIAARGIRHDVRGKERTAFRKRMAHERDSEPIYRPLFREIRRYTGPDRPGARDDGAGDQSS